MEIEVVSDVDFEGLQSPHLPLKNPLNADLFGAELSRGAAVVKITYKKLAETSVRYNEFSRKLFIEFFLSHVPLYHKCTM